MKQIIGLRLESTKKPLNSEQWNMAISNPSRVFFWVLRVCLSFKPWLNENSNHRKFLLVFAYASFDCQLAVACVSLRLICACSNFTASFFFPTCDSLRVVWTQNTSRCKSFLPARALELAEVSELYIGDSIYRESTGESSELPTTCADVWQVASQVIASKPAKN